MVRSTPSARTFWSSRIASNRPMAMAPPTNSTPKTAMLVMATWKRSLSSSRAYWSSPANS
jgi:hypothetical protein